MKRTLCIITALVICLTIAVTTVAADVFVPSVTAKPAPEVVTGDNNEVKIEVVDNNDKTVDHFEPVHIEVTPVADKDKTSVDKEVKEALTDAYTTLSSTDAKLEEVMPSLTDVAAEGKVKVADLVVKDLFHVAVSDEIEKALETEGNALKLTVDAKIAKNQFVAVMVCVDGEWIPVDFVVNEDGSITCMMDVVGVVAILVKP